jgi:glycosyltransferase involved in cell wall biosynthesis
MVTYNHERFITRAVESVLMQETTFRYDLVIGEDFSSDRTRTIVGDFQRQYPSIIRLLLSDENHGGMVNFVQTLRDCQGSYIALLDGDDYWTSRSKLQKQADFLDNHPDYAMCYHDVLTFHEDERLESRTISAKRQRISTLADLLLVSPPSCSVMFRRGLFVDFPNWFHTLEIGDWPLHILNAQSGRIGYIDDVMAARRKHSGGVYSSLTRMAKLEAKLKVYECLDAHLGGRYRGIVRGMMAKCYYGMAVECERSGEAERARALARKCLTVKPFSKYVSAMNLTGMLLRLNWRRLID